ncbi:MAG TPA: M48 family metalloprotease [Gemmataceae bacterium]|nr:M48 family metalloprotease [Gemmataceae bacterium]
MDVAHLYPPGPTNVPPDLTRPDRAYRLRAVAMIAGLFGFLVLYLIFIALAAVVAYGLWLLPVPAGRGAGILLIAKVGGIAAAGLLCLFLFKGLFKGRTVPRATHVPLREADHPELFAFVRRVYQDTGSPAPRRIVVTPEVNAALVYDTSLLNLVVPPKKDLLIGLGLVNTITLSEFKAVMAHEFGHFAQRSVGLGSYLYVANRVMHDVIYSRDALDRLVDTWASIDVRVSFPAWGLKGVLWAVRGILGGTYKALNLLHLSLSRQMEFNADNVAVSVAGAEALVHGLARLEFANECLGDAARSLDAAADHGHFSDDLFFHQARSAERLRALRKNPRLGCPPDHPAAEVFPPVDDGIPDKYRSHPTDHMREQNVKRSGVVAPRDDRSPWLLFPDAAALKHQVTEVFYRHLLNRTEPYDPRPAAQVQAVIDADHAESTYDPKYHGWYDDRFLDPGDLSQLPESLEPEAATAWLANWPPADLEVRVRTYAERLGERNVLQGLKDGSLTLKGQTFTLRGEERTFRDVTRLLGEVEKELEEADRDFQRLDRDVLLAHRAIAGHLDATGEREAELLRRYKFHTDLQGLMRGMMGEQARLQSIVTFLSGQTQLSNEDFEEVRRLLREIRDSLTNNLEDTKRFVTPELANVPAGSSLHSVIVDRGDVRIGPMGDSISGEWIGRLGTRLDGVLTRIKRLHFKSLGGLLAYQERLTKEWAAR